MLAVDVAGAGDASVEVDDSLLDAPASPLEVPASADDFAARALPGEALAARSFFAHPEPLKWTVGVVNPFRSVPSAPQAGQNRGPAAWIPWITSVTTSQRAQT